MNQSPEPDWLADARHYYQQGNLLAARQLLQPYQTRPDAVLLLLQCLLEQGHFQEAFQVGYAAATSSYQTIVEQELGLRCAFLQLYLTGDLHPILTTGKTILAKGDLNQIVALAYDLLARAYAAAVVWGLSDTSNLLAHSQQLAKAADLYRRFGDEASAQKAQIRQAQLLLTLASPDTAQAKTILQDVQSAAYNHNLLPIAADVTLRLAELSFADAPPTSPDNYLPGYHEALALYERCGHKSGIADVQYSWGKQLIRFGLDGRSVLQQALTNYTEHDNLSGISQVISELAVLEVRQGNLDNGLAYHQQNSVVAQKMGFAQAKVTTQMGIGDIYFRTGDYGRALAAYDQAEKLARAPNALALIRLNQANLYTLMHLPERAEASCRSAIAILSPNGTTTNLSLAYFILGNVLGAQKAWDAALIAWRDGLTVDEALGDAYRQAEKLQLMAQATIQQHYHGRGSIIPDGVYQETQTLFAQALHRLTLLDDKDATILRANIQQLQGQSAVTAQRFADAEQHLLLARIEYVALAMGMETATTDALLGLLYFGVANEGQYALYETAETHYHYALTYYQSANMRDQMWPLHYYLADIYFMRGQLQPIAAQMADWRLALYELEQAAEIMDFIRGRFAQVDRLAQDEARTGLVANQARLYRFAIRLTYRYLRDKIAVFNWVQRAKGRAFLDALTITKLHPPDVKDESSLHQESVLLEQLNQEANQIHMIDFLDKLHEVWAQMATSGLDEYVALRRGDPVRWKEIAILLSTS
jgi:hypothetical protein